MSKKHFRRYSILKDNMLQAVHDDDLLSLLESLGVSDKINSGLCLCTFCKAKITYENLGAILPVHGEIAFSCDSPMCLNFMVEAGESYEG